jgi:hypothetical protein
VLAVAQPQDGQILLFATNGQRVGTLGRKGSGPGEFQAISGLGWKQDTVWVVDNRTHRLTFFRGNGRLLRTVPLPTTTADSPAPAVRALRSPRLVAVGATGRMLFRASGVPSRTGGRAFTPRRTWIVGAGADGSLGDTVWTEPPNDCRRAVAGAEILLPFCAQPIVEFSSDGSRTIHVREVRHERDSAVVEVTAVAATGRTVFTRQIRVQATHIPESTRDSTAREMRSGEPVVVALQAGYVVPRFYPAIVHVALAGTGDAWLGLRADREATYREWIVIDGNGLSHRTTRLPRNTNPVAAEIRGLWAGVPDEEGVENILLFARP